METIRLSNLEIGYRDHDSVKRVATGINASISSGELTCLLGVNGIGKSTLLRTLSAFQPKLSGDIFIEEKEIGEYTDKQLARKIGVVLTERPDVRNMTVREIVSLGRSPYTGFFGTLNESDRRIVGEAIEMAGISRLATRTVHTLSDGERQRAMIAKALAQQTPIIILDEPTAFLDYPSKVEMMLLLRRLCSDMQKTVFLSTHDLEIALQTADRLWLMQPDGISIGTPRQLADNGALSRYVERPEITLDRQSLTIRIAR